MNDDLENNEAPSSESAETDLTRLVQVLSNLSQCGAAEEGALHHSTSFQELVTEVRSRYARYEHRTEEARKFVPLLEHRECREHVRAFLHHSHFFETHLREATGTEEFANRLDTEFRRDSSKVTHLVLVDGLELPDDEIAFDGGRLVRLNKAFLSDWFGGRTPPSHEKTVDLDGVAAIEFVRTDKNPPFGLDDIDWEPYQTRMSRAAYPWLTFLNLYGPGKCSATGLYLRSDSMLHWDRFAAIGIEEPTRMPRSFNDPDGHETFEFEELYPTLRIDDVGCLQTFLNRMAAGRAAAQGNSHRLETALRYFGRMSDRYLNNVSLPVLYHQLDALEDIVVHATIGLEAIYVNRNKRQGSQIAMRSSMILESDSTLRRTFRDAVQKLYGVRSNIVHGDERRTARELLDNAVKAESLFRRSLIALCLLEGDHSRVILDKSDETKAQAVRDQVRLG
jgi:hypothetical protein